MNIKHTVPGFKREHKQNNNFLSTILDRVFAICKEDKNFSSKSKTDQMDSKIISLKEKIKKQENLLVKAKEIEENTKIQLDDIGEQNYTMKVRLLEILGSEL